MEEKTEFWNPFEDEKVVSDPYKTLIVSRLNYATTEKGLKHEFEVSGSLCLEIWSNQECENY